MTEMTTPSDRDAIERTVQDCLPDLVQQSEDDLFRLAAAPIAEAAGDPDVPFGTDSAQLWGLLDASNLRAVVCHPDNKALITGTIDVANVTSLVAVVLPLMGMAAAAAPVGVVAVAVLILKIGVNQYCRGYTPPAAPSMG